MLYFVRRSCQLNARNSARQTACIIASMNGHTEAVIILLTFRGYGGGCGCDLHLVDNTEMTAFLYASRHGHVGVLQVLKDHGAALHAPDRNGVEPALLTAMNGHNAALGWFDSVGRIRMKDEHFKALAQCTLAPRPM